jgi:two-component system cell cycle response regulator CtrA
MLAGTPQRDAVGEAMRVLLIEDDSAVRFGIELVLRTDAMCVDSTDRGDDGVETARHYDYDVSVLDLRLPDMSGFDVVRSLRSAKVQTPVIILSGSAMVEDKIKALKAGADDYLTKPFRAEELTARLRTLVRRSRGLCDARICIGPMTLDLAAKILEVGGRRIALSAKEYQILELLSLRHGTAVSKEMLMDHIYGDGDGPDSSIMEVLVHRLRRKLALACKGGCFIETVRDRGYLMRQAA